MSRAAGGSWIALLCCPVLPACLGTESPLSDPAASKFDDALVGTWKQVGGGSEFEFVHIGRSSLVHEVDWGEIISVSYRGDRISIAPSMIVFPTEIDGKKHLNAIAFDDEVRSQLAVNRATRARSDLPALMKHAQGYLVFRYEVDGDQLTIHTANERIVQNAIAAGQIRGVRGQLSDTTDIVVAFLRKRGDDVFTGETLRFTRLR